VERMPVEETAMMTGEFWILRRAVTRVFATVPLSRQSRSVFMRDTIKLNRKSEA